MKKITLILSVYLLNCFYTKSQECVFKVNKKDEFTGKSLLNLSCKLSSDLTFFLSREDSTYGLQVSRKHSKLKIYSEKRGDPIIILFKDSSKLFLKVTKFDEKITGQNDLFENISMFSHKEFIVLSCVLEKIDVENLSNKEITKIRIPAIEENEITHEETNNFEDEIKEKAAKKLNKACVCIQTGDERKGLEIEKRKEEIEKIKNSQKLEVTIPNASPFTAFILAKWELIKIEPPNPIFMVTTNEYFGDGTFTITVDNSISKVDKNPVYEFTYIVSKDGKTLEIKNTKSGKTNSLEILLLTQDELILKAEGKTLSYKRK